MILNKNFKVSIYVQKNQESKSFYYSKSLCRVSQGKILKEI